MKKHTVLWGRIFHISDSIWWGLGLQNGSQNHTFGPKNWWWWEKKLIFARPFLGQHSLRIEKASRASPESIFGPLGVNFNGSRGKFVAFFGSSLLVLVGEMGYLFLVPNFFGNNLLVTRYGLNLKLFWGPEKLTNMHFCQFWSLGLHQFLLLLDPFFPGRN